MTTPQRAKPKPRRGSPRERIELPDLPCWRPERERMLPPRLRAAADETDDPHVLTLFDMVGFVPFDEDENANGRAITTPDALRAALDALPPGELLVQINSPGGEASAAFTIYNLLRGSRRQVTVQVLGMAASAASLVAMAGDRVEIAGNASMMIHNAWSVVGGNSEELRHYADQLDVADEQQVATYAAKTGRRSTEIRAAMDATTWYTADQAVDFGLADVAVEGALDVAACSRFDLDRLNPPARILELIEHESDQLDVAGRIAEITAHDGQGLRLAGR